MSSQIEVPPTWENLTVSAMSDVILVIGATDTGKTTFARYLYWRLGAYHERLAFVDGDMGQASLGPSTTMTLALNEPGDDSFPPAGSRFRTFVGDVSPRGHMLPTLVGAHRLVRKAREAGSTAIIFDTTGLVDATQGGGALKLALVNLLQPTVVVGIQRRSELEHLLVPLRCSARTRVIDLRMAPAVRPRDVSERRKHRADCFSRYFEGARLLEVSWRGQAVIPAPRFMPRRLVALEDSGGFVLGLGIIASDDPDAYVVELRTPLSSPEGVDVIHLGDLALDPVTFCDTRLE